MRLRNTDDFHDFRFTDDELARIHVPKVIRPTVTGEAAQVNANTRAYRKLLAALRLQSDLWDAEADAVEARQRLDRVNGEARTLDETRRQLAAMRKERDDAIAGEQTARRQAEIAAAKPAIAVHAQGTGR